MENEIDFRLQSAERAAAGVIDEFGICSPEHIRVHDIAYAKGAIVIEEYVRGAAASVVKLKSHATVRVSPADSLERKRFSIAHELGHLLLNHVQSIQKICTAEDMLNWYQKSHETQANFFASELILPTTMVTPYCDVELVNFEPIKAIAKQFRASLTATAIKFVRLCPEKCAVVYSVDGKLRWFFKSSDWWPYIKRDRELDKRTLAYDFFNGRTLEPDPQEVDADAWVESHGDEVVEHSIASSQYGFVLSVLWIKPN